MSTPSCLASSRSAGFKLSAIALKKAFPDLRYTIEDSIESGDKIVHRLTARGTMKADFMGMPATGKSATWTEIHIGRVANGLLTEHWGLADQLGMLVQLGVVQSPARVPVAVWSSPTTSHRSPGGDAGALSCVQFDRAASESTPLEPLTER